MPQCRPRSPTAPITAVAAADAANAPVRSRASVRGPVGVALKVEDHVANDWQVAHLLTTTLADFLVAGEAAYAGR